MIFPLMGLCTASPVTKGNPVNTSDWQKTHDNLFRFNSTESSGSDYKSVLGVPIVVNKQNQGAIVLERRTNTRFSEI